MVYFSRRRPLMRHYARASAMFCHIFAEVYLPADALIRRAAPIVEIDKRMVYAPLIKRNAAAAAAPPFMRDDAGDICRRHAAVIDMRVLPSVRPARRCRRFTRCWRCRARRCSLPRLLPRAPYRYSARRACYRSRHYRMSARFHVAAYTPWRQRWFSRCWL